MALEIDLADDRIVPNILLDGPFERFATHVDPPYLRRLDLRPWALGLGPRDYPARSTARSLALRARALPSTSAAAGVTGRFVRIATCPSACNARKVCFTMRSSSE